MKKHFAFFRIIVMGAIAIVLHISSAYAIELNTEAILGKWEHVISNPMFKNSVTERYMQHIFLEDGKLVVAKTLEENDTNTWVIKDDHIVVTSYSPSRESRFAQWYKLISEDELMLVRFQRFEGNELKIDHEEKDKFIRQGSNLHNGMRTCALLRVGKKCW